MGATKKQKIRDGKYAGRPAKPTAKAFQVEAVGLLPHGTKFCSHSALLTLAIANHSFNHRKRNIKPLALPKVT